MILAIRPLSHRVIRGGLVLLSLALVAVPWSSAQAKAKKTPAHCRDIQFKGAAGAESEDLVKFRVKNSTGNVIDESCLLQVRHSESDVHFTQRLPEAWGVSGGGVCPPAPPSQTPAPGSTPVPPPITCGGVISSGYACTHEYLTTAAPVLTDPAIQTLRICCWKSKVPKPPAPPCSQADLSCCSGKKIHTVDKKRCTAGLNVGGRCKEDKDCDTVLALGDGRCGRKPITIQTKVENNLYDPPDSNIPFTGVAPAQIVVDPIGVVQLPSAETQKCRATLGKAMNAYAAGRAQALIQCAFDDLREKGCDTDKQDALLEQLDLGFRAAATKACEPLGPPRRLGYAACPPPCNSIVISTCKAGRTGQPCATDPNCDTTPDSGDGLCGPGDWAAARNCMVCLADTTIDDAVGEAFGFVTAPVSPEAERCQVGIGNVLAYLIANQTKENATCQATVDGAKTPLVFCQLGVCSGPPQAVGNTCTTSADCFPLNDPLQDAQLCKYADTQSLRAEAEAAARLKIGESCNSETDPFGDLDSCGNDPATEADCIINQGRIVGQTLADAVYPEGIGHTAP